jgi:hypothetical protein
LFQVSAQILEDFLLPLLDFEQDWLRHARVVPLRMDLARVKEDSPQIADALLREQHLFVGLNHGSFRLTFRGPSGKVIVRGWGSVSFTPVVNAEDADQIRWFEAEKYPPLADPKAQFPGAVFEGLHLAVARRGESYQRCIDPCLNHAIKPRQIAHRGRAENYATDHTPSRRRTSSRGTSSPGSERASSSLAAVSASMISCSPNSARKDIATCTSLSGRASTSD